MPQITIQNVEVDFPFEPYKCQEDYMQKVIQALQHRQNAILESPTGTGKTLCLLCSVLAWRLTYIAKMQLNGLVRNAVVSGLNEAVGSEQAASVEPFLEIPKIIYASRTHSQISQVVNELKNTIYKPKVSVIGSRDQMCLNPKVMNIENTQAKIHTCRSLVKQRTCVHHGNVEKKIQDSAFDAILDIEELVNIAKDKTMCPYYSSRELLKQADVIFMPYNYLIDRTIRKNQNIVLQNAIIIFDEAHNIEKVCEEAFSFEITSTDIANCIENCQLALLRITENEPENNVNDPENNELTKEDVLTMKAIFLSLEREFNKIDVRGYGGIIEKTTFRKLLLSINVNSETKELILDVLKKMQSVLSVNNNKIVGNTLTVLSNFMQILDLTLDEEENSQNSYVCYVSKEPIAKKGPKGWKDPNLEAVAPKCRTKLSYWCFTPGVAMQHFVRQGVYSIILTSGTLSPLASFSCELKIPFPVTLQNPHVVTSSQICVQVLCKGCDNEELLSTYANRTNPKYMASLGNTIINLLRVIPNGVLVFFPSYTVMNTTIDSWKEGNIFDRMGKIKECFIEPRSKAEMSTVMSDFDHKVKDPTFNTTGAVLFAVCRGKASEGIDFADTHGRGVIITGLPFPPRQDPKIDSKIKFLGRQKTTGSDSLDGDQWYMQQSSRAVNQAVGRVIRHKDDFGAVILMDKRFSFTKNVDELPKWAREFTRIHPTFDSCFRELSMFFKKQVPRKPDEKMTLAKSYKGTLSKMCDEFKQGGLPKEKRVLTVPLPDPDESVEHTPPPSHFSQKTKRVSLISTLNNANTPSFNMSPQLSPLTSRSKEAQDFKTPEVLKNPRKRIKLVSNQQENVIPSSSRLDRVQPHAERVKSSGEKRVKSVVIRTESVRATAPDKKIVSADTDRMQNCKDYSNLIRTSLNSSEYASFKTIIKKYKEKCDMEVLIDEIGKLLLQNHKNLLRGFRVFLNPKDRPIFDRYANESWFSE